MKCVNVSRMELVSVWRSERPPYTLRMCNPRSSEDETRWPLLGGNSARWERPPFVEKEKTEPCQRSYIDKLLGYFGRMIYCYFSFNHFCWEIFVLFFPLNWNNHQLSDCKNLSSQDNIASGYTTEGKII